MKDVACNRASRLRATSIGRLLASLLVSVPSPAHEGDPHVEHEIALSYSGPLLPTGSPQAHDAIDAIFRLGARVHNSADQALIPAGTTIDELNWSENVLEFYLTLPAHRPADWRLSPLDLETITTTLHRPFRHDPRFGGTRIRIRESAASPIYHSLEHFVPELRESALTDYSR